MSVTRDEWDEQLGRWRWPEVENLIVYKIGEGRVRVVDEFDGVTWQVLKEEVNIETGVPQIFAAAARDYFKAHEPKPWHDAKPGEAWVLTVGGSGTAQVVDGYSRFRPWGIEVQSNGNDRGSITDARRIWPEVVDA